MAPKKKAIKAQATMAKPANNKSRNSSSSSATMMGGGGGNAVDKILHALAQLEKMGINRPERAVAGVCAGVLVSTSTWRNACAKLKKDGLVDTTSDSLTIALTDKGRGVAVGSTTTVPAPKSNAEFQKRLLTLIKATGKTREIFEYLATIPTSSGNGGATRADIAQHIHTDITKSTFRNAMAPLNKWKLLESVNGGDSVRLVDFCFPIGRDA